MIKNSLVLLTILVLSFSCVSKKKFIAQGDAFRYQQDSLQAIIQSLDYEKDTFRMALAYERGANATLFTTQDRLQDRLDVLQLEIDHLTDNASSTQQNLSSDIRGKEAEIQALEDQLMNIQTVFSHNKERLTAFLDSIQPSFEGITADSISLRNRSSQLVIAIGENALFRKSSTSTLTSGGKALLVEIAEKIQAFPEMQIQVIGHTDNRDVNRQNLDNWQYSALRAVTVVKYLSGEAELGANRVIAVTKSEFAPLESNETKEGRARNRRIELVITPPVGYIEQKIIQKL